MTRENVASRSGPRPAFMLVCLLALGIASRAAAYSTGVSTTFLLPDPTKGCNNVGCHSGGQMPTVTLTGPMAVAPNSTNEYVVAVHAVGAQTKGGFNISALSGTLAKGGSASAGTQTFPGTGGRTEVTHLGAKASVGGVTTFSFQWTAPAAFTTVTLNAWGNAVNGDNQNTGDQAAFTTLTVSAGAAASPTPSASPTATPAPPTATATRTPTHTQTPPDTATPEPTATDTPMEPVDTPTVAATVPPVSRPGDANCDGRVSAADLPGLAILVVDQLVDVCGFADANNDGAIDPSDLRAAIDAIFEP